MTVELDKGQNTPLGADQVYVTVQLAAPVDVSALLVTANGTVRSDADFIFYNQPDGPGVHARQVDGAWRIEIDTSQLPGDIDQVRCVASLDASGQRFGQFPAPIARVHDAAGTVLADYSIIGLDRESIVIAVEIYRRGGAWKVRAVGQGYDGGLADLISDHGVSVDGAPPPAAAAPPPQPAAAPPLPPAAAALPPAAAAPPPPVGPPTLPGTFPPPPAHPGWPEPSGPGSAPLPPAPGFPPGPPAAPPGYPAAPPNYPPPPTGPSAAGGEISLNKARPVSLVKGQRVSLRKEDGQQLTLVRMGLGWDAITRRGLFGSRQAEIDLDASVIMLADNSVVDVVFYNNLRSQDGSIMHSGDNRTGEGAGDDETVIIDLPRVSVHVGALFLVVTSYEGQTFEHVANAYCRLIENSSNAELARYTLAGGMPFTGLVMAKLYRDGGQWKLQAIGEGIQARTPIDAQRQLARFV